MPAPGIPGARETTLRRRTYTSVVEKEGDGYVALCPELDVASQGATAEEAARNLQEAVDLFLETADPAEVAATVKAASRDARRLLGALRVMTGREVCAVLEAAGFAEVGRRGGHVVLQPPPTDGMTTVTVPDADLIRVGTLQSIIRQSGLERSLFEE